MRHRNHARIADFDGAFEKERIFFSEEKKQKTFNSGACGKIPAIASIVGAAKT
jgi:hypothetical protein